jgi:hypothetical protein
MKATRVLCLIAALGIAGCSTPQAVLDTANNTAAMVGELDKELREFRRVQAGFDRHRKDLIRAQAEAISLSESVIAENQLFGAATAAHSVDTTVRSIQAMTDGLASIDRKTQADLTALDQRLAELTSPLPATTDKAVGAQKALILMGSELSSSERLAELKAFYETVREGVEKNKQKIKDAEEKAAGDAEKAAASQ